MSQPEHHYALQISFDHILIGLPLQGNLPNGRQLPIQISGHMKHIARSTARNWHGHVALRESSRCQLQHNFIIFTSLSILSLSFPRCRRCNGTKVKVKCTNRKESIDNKERHGRLKLQSTIESLTIQNASSNENDVKHANEAINTLSTRCRRCKSESNTLIEKRA